jgi:putative membrane-bound dehydrogenase-like protein
MKPAAFVVLAAYLTAVSAVAAERIGSEPPRVKSPVAPRESLKNIVVPNGLKVELVACEPQIIDPVAIRFDEAERLWVVEMRDYPTGPTKEHPAGSRISVLRDQDGDAFYETATVFADNLRFATGLQPWKGGVFVTMAGEVAYMKDTDGDDKADVNETWYKGFSEGNQQLRANHPRLALDNHIYIANGLRGGEIIDARKPDAKPVSISGMDFRFDPHTHKFEPVSGVGQFGLTFNDYGNRFVCTNRNPVIHIVLEDRDLKKNPLVVVPTVMHDVAKAAADSRLYPIAKSWTTSHLHANQFTAACGVEVYRGSALGEEYYGNVFTCDPTAHLVHREVMKPNGVTFTSWSPDDGKDFFASRDEWCSPVNLESGPDGALYVVDMYRAVIEHPEWVPEELKHRPDQMLGNDLGRIYRVVPVNFKRGQSPNLDGPPSTALMKSLASANAWERETAARLLLERQESAPTGELQAVAIRHASPLARIHALRLLAATRKLSDHVLTSALGDKNERVIEQAILAAADRGSVSKELRGLIAKKQGSRDARVRFQALLAVTSLPDPPKFPVDLWEADAILITSGSRGGEVLARMLEQPEALKSNFKDPGRFIGELARLAAASPDERQRLIAAEALANQSSYQRPGLTALLAETSRREMPLDDLLAKLSPTTRAHFERALAAARTDAHDADQTEKDRCEAIGLLSFVDDAAATLTPLAVRESNQNIRLRSIAALAKVNDLEPWQQLLSNFSSATPELQRAILDGMLVEPARVKLLLDEVEARRIKPTEFDANHLKQLLELPDAGNKERAEKLLAAAIPADRAKALADYQVVLTMKANPARGRGVFEKRCATCHRVANVGIQFAPDISDSREKSPAQLLTDIIQPNRAIDSNFFSYTAITNTGQAHTGVLASETSTGVTLKQAEGKSITLRRDEIDELHSDGVSFMPEGLERDIPPQDMADLISFIKNWRYLEPGETVPAAR